MSYPSSPQQNPEFASGVIWLR